jgi:hypothetical protein
MAILTGMTASPTTIMPGETSTITPTFTNDPAEETITGVDENGNAASVTVTIQGSVSFVVVPTLPPAAPAGQLNFALSNAALGTLAVATGGTTLVFTAA